MNMAGRACCITNAKSLTCSAQNEFASTTLTRVTRDPCPSNGASARKHVFSIIARATI